EVDREQAGSTAVGYLLRKIFRDSPKLLLSRLVDDSDLSEEDLRELRSLLDERLSSGGESGEGHE
ncbi:MAG: BlaI/MecI/CopY family transcriptional regulator, partial [Candidatus Palauibacterales bacterium]|nr:BlaI/MecI/CopY family transcriptional regulator [Candidatus Palauibacterales bacterium]